MFSLRTLARRAPRNTAQLAHYTTRSASRPSIQSFAAPNSISARWRPITASFSTSASRFDDSSMLLVKKLETEIDIEVQNNQAETDSDSNVKAYLEQNSQWTLSTEEGEQDVLMQKKYDDEEISVYFSIADFNSPPMMPEEEDDQAFMDESEDVETSQSGGANTKGAINQGRTSGGNIKVAPEDSVAPADREELRNEEDDMDNQGDQSPFPANVHVLIQRSGKPGALRVHLVTDGESGFTVHGVTHLPSSSTSSAKEILRNPPETVYAGPPFQQLDEELQTHIESYLESRGLDLGLATFIPDYIDVKEQKEYLAMLERMKDFVE